MQPTQFGEKINPPDEVKLKPLRLLVCGGRNYSNITRVAQTLDRVHRVRGIAVVIHGGARGADAIAGIWAWRKRIEIKAYPADWHTHGRAAGPIRNQRMLDEGRPDMVVAFKGGRGTADMVRRARQACIPVLEVYE
jgi:hypothetical protein